ncbi:Kynureninase (L-kynurenine hydrolase) [Apophysomyces sp. BC1034]|nr:Kynureninase (L-kynurenine hydrolase) [Apophysomyces sp. BC1015]KAG0178621.1 Kynureninase (L-kynurenine hydrolase) [Apophysomyces sp. BC1021]KAG0188946.1 Kynureninase (L-kynurenine hydrolase) [Apophysomyces sp. BC1034]
MIQDIATQKGLEVSSAKFAEELDREDSLAKFRDEFAIPTRRQVSGKEPVAENDSDLDQSCTYLCGNSLGLMPKRSRELVIQELDVWAARGVEGHWNHPHGRPWVTIDEVVKEPLAHLVGAKPLEVTAMNTLTSNLHAMLVTFYRPTSERFKILIEKKAFPSDHYAVSSHIQSRGIDPSIGLLTVAPRPGEHVLRTEDIISTIRQNKDIALVLISGVQYYTGQCFEMEKITKAGHEAGCIVGWDLAHAVGNVPLHLHDWDVDFACWCSYKYLNSGAGGIAGLFIHEKYAKDFDKPRLAGWWGNDKSNRFEMSPEFQPSEGASGYQVSNPSFLTTISLLGSLQLFEEAGLDNLRKKSVLLTGYMETLLLTVLEGHHQAGHFRILTPREADQRGCQLSLEFPERMMEVFDKLQSRGVICDERKPTVIRVAPTPLYSTFADVRRFVFYLKDILDAMF